MPHYHDHHYHHHHQQKQQQPHPLPSIFDTVPLVEHKHTPIITTTNSNHKARMKMFRGALGLDDDADADDANAEKEKPENNSAKKSTDTSFVQPNSEIVQTPQDVGDDVLFSELNRTVKRVLLRPDALRVMIAALSVVGLCLVQYMCFDRVAPGEWTLLFGLAMVAALNPDRFFANRGFDDYNAVDVKRLRAWSGSTSRTGISFLQLNSQNVPHQSFRNITPPAKVQVVQQQSSSAVKGKGGNSVKRKFNRRRTLSAPELKKNSKTTTMDVKTAKLPNFVAPNLEIRSISQFFFRQIILNL